MANFEEKRKELERIYRKIAGGESLSDEEHEFMNKGRFLKKEEETESTPPLEAIVVPTLDGLLEKESFRTLVSKATTRGLSRSNALEIVSSLSSLAILKELREVKKLLEEMKETMFETDEIERTEPKKQKGTRGRK